MPIVRGSAGLYPVCKERSTIHPVAIDQAMQGVPQTADRGSSGLRFIWNHLHTQECRDPVESRSIPFYSTLRTKESTHTRIVLESQCHRECEVQAHPAIIARNWLTKESPN